MSVVGFTADQYQNRLAGTPTWDNNTSANYHRQTVGLGAIPAYSPLKRETIYESGQEGNSSLNVSDNQKVITNDGGNVTISNGVKGYCLSFDTLFEALEIYMSTKEILYQGENNFRTVADFGEGRFISINPSNQDVSIQNNNGFGIVAHFDNLCLMLKEGFKADISI